MELDRLREQLNNLRMLYEDAVMYNKPAKELVEIVEQIKNMENLIKSRQEIMKRRDSEN